LSYLRFLHLFSIAIVTIIAADVNVNVDAESIAIRMEGLFFFCKVGLSGLITSFQWIQSSFVGREQLGFLHPDRGC
jgi:hypothetical protein